MTDLGLVVVDLPPDGPAGVGPLAAAAEAAGASAVWLTDHQRWHRPCVDVIGGLHAVAAATSRCRLGPCVLQLPLRDLAGTAKSMAYLGALAGDRLVVGVGVGEHRREYELCGHGDRFARRGRLLDAGIAELRERWAPSGDDERLVLAPTATPPIWVGGRSAAARRRAAQLGDGWIPHLCRADWFAAEVPRLAADVRAAGRDGEAFTRAAAVAVFVEEVEPETDPHAWLGRLYDLPPATFARAVVRGTATQVVSELDAFAAAGADHLALVVAGDRPVDHLRAVVAERRARGD
ncbi:MAG: LLM class flavin-dependent oxidoreductase [Acidimicrobiales bacterium]|nr:LLM class flavin-dependent oxidoreductase [Acidimicrobiales bacterium]HRW36843.1 LLM class flavin-dependent oxidoreductase [Aquihabitans sp.]